MAGTALEAAVTSSQAKGAIPNPKPNPFPYPNPDPDPNPDPYPYPNQRFDAPRSAEPGAAATRPTGNNSESEEDEDAVPGTPPDSPLAAKRARM